MEILVSGGLEKKNGREPNDVFIFGKTNSSREIVSQAVMEEVTVVVRKRSKDPMLILSLRSAGLKRG